MKKNQTTTDERRTAGHQVPRISSVKTCSSVSIISTSASGYSYASGRTSSSALVSAAGACGDAVSDGLGALCGGADPGVAIVAAAQVCGNALAALYSRGASSALNLPGGAAWTPKRLLDRSALSKLQPTRQGFTDTCAGSCNNAQSAAEALAQGAACGASKATGGCVAVTTEVRGEVFARAFSSVASDSWTKACSKGAGAALTGTEAMAAAASAAFASAVARVAAHACASCPACKCKRIPGLGALGVNTAGKWQSTFSTFAGGKVGLARALARASGAMCRGGTTNVTKAATESAMAAVAGMVGGAAGKVHAGALQVGGGSACSANSLATDFEAMKSAGAAVLSDAAASAFGDWCPAAAARLKNVTLLTSDTISRAAARSADACAASRPRKGLFGAVGLPSLGASETDRIVGQLVFSNEPVRRKVADALTEAKRCGCPPSLCLWCTKADKAPLPGLPAPSAAVMSAAAAAEEEEEAAEAGGGASAGGGGGGGSSSSVLDDELAAAASSDPKTAELFKALGYI